MFPIPSVLFAGLVLLRFILLGDLHIRLFRYRRPPDSSFAWSGIRPLRPHQYLDEGQDLPRKLWLVLVLTIPWWIVGFTVFSVAERAAR